MQVRTTAKAPAATMAATFILLLHHDKWRWNQNTSYTIRAAIAFFNKSTPTLGRKTATSDNLAGGLIVWNFPDGSRLGIIKKDKTCWEIDAEGFKKSLAEQVS